MFLTYPCLKAHKANTFLLRLHKRPQNDHFLHHLIPSWQKHQFLKAGIDPNAIKGGFVPLSRRSPTDLTLISCANAAKVGKAPKVTA
jgi:hypothetical protein